MGLRWTFFLSLLWLLSWTRILSSFVEGCPRNCFCSAISKIVYCSRRGLALVPDHLPIGTLQLNLNANAFRSHTLQRSNFSRHVTLEHLYLSDCAIEAVEADTFVDFTRLKWLDMSDNRIKVIYDNTFRGLRLQHLFLNGNRGMRLLTSSFEGLATTGLYLHDCGMTSIAPEVLLPLNGSLGNLWLNGNQLERVDEKLRLLFSSLVHLRLASNPLRCSCEAIWLKEFFDANYDLFRGAEVPGCQTPARLRGRHFGQLSVGDFLCQSPVFSSVDALFFFFGGGGGSGAQLKCAATGDPTPSLYWIQPSGKAIKFDPPSTDEGLSRNEATLLLSNSNSISETRSEHAMSGMYICIANNEAGNSTLTIKVTWPSSLKQQQQQPMAADDSIHHQFLLRPHPQHPQQQRDRSGVHSSSADILPLTLTSTSAAKTEDYALVTSSTVSDVTLFTLTELTLSVLVTHFATIVVSIGCICVCCQRTKGHKGHQAEAKGTEDNALYHHEGQRLEGQETTRSMNNSGEGEGGGGYSSFVKHSPNCTEFKSHLHISRQLPLTKT